MSRLRASLNYGHDCSYTLFNYEEGVKYFFKGERYSRKKRSMHNESWVKVEPFLINNNIEVEGMFDRPYYNIKHYNDHHLCHAACAFYHSGFEESLIFVIDRNGSQV